MIVEETNTNPVSSLKGRSPEKPGRVLMMEVDETMSKTTARTSTCCHIVMIYLFKYAEIAL